MPSNRDFDEERERRLSFGYRCHRCRRMRGPDQFAEEMYTFRVKTTCEICVDKQLEKERAKEYEQRARDRIRESLNAAAARERENHVVDSDIEEGGESLVPVVEVVDSFEARRQLGSLMAEAENELRLMMEKPPYNLNNVSVALKGYVP